MISLFRKIRYRLARDNRPASPAGRFLQYSRYAIGEIVLVVIGILIALQINDWNDHRKERLKEKELELALLSDFQETKKRLQETIRKQQQVIDYAHQLIVSYENKQLMALKDSLPNLIGVGFGAWWRAEPVTKTYQSMISTGSIVLLSNNELKQKLADFHAELDSGFEDQEESMYLLDALNKQLAPYEFLLKNNNSRRELSLEPLRDSELKNIVNEEDIIKLQADPFTFNLGMKRMILEMNRLDSQQKMAALVDSILSILNKHD